MLLVYLPRIGPRSLFHFAIEVVFPRPMRVVMPLKAMNGDRIVIREPEVRL